MNLLTVGYLALIVVAFYFLLIRPNQKRQKETQELMASLEVGDRVVTAGGLFGTIERIEDDLMELRIADGVVVDMARSSVVRRAERVETEPAGPEASDEHPHLESGDVEEPPVHVDDESAADEFPAPPSPADKKDE